MTYMEYAKRNGHSESEILEMVDGIFGAETEMDEIISRDDTSESYDMGNGYILNVNYSSHDTVDRIDYDGELIETWSLDY